MRLILHWVILSVAVYATSKIVSGININILWSVLIVGACLSLFNMFVKPIINILTLPLNIVTLGVFSLIINGLIFWYIGNVVNGFSVESFKSAFFGALVISILGWVLKKIFPFD